MYDTFAFFVRISSIYAIIYMKRGVTLSSRFLGPTAEDAINKSIKAQFERMAEQRSKMTKEDFQRLGEYFDSVLQMQEETLHDSVAQTQDEETLHDSHPKTLKRTNNK